MALALAAGLLLAWLLVDPRTPDLAAQVYRVDLYKQIGLGVFDTRWYGGHALPGYGLLFAPLAALVGIRVLAAASVLVSVALFERLVLHEFGGERLVRLGACLFALAAVGDVWSGRLTFALGVTFALACAYVLARRRLAWAALLAALCALASPVAGLLLALAGLTYALSERSPSLLASVALPVAVVLIPLQALFGEGGFEPFPAGSFAASVLVSVVFLCALRRSERLLRLGGALYLLACVLALAIHSPLGSNLERYAALLAAPLLACSLGRPRGPERRASRLAGLGAIALIVVWVAWGPVRETLAVAGSQDTARSYYAPAEHFLLAHGAALERVEVPLTRSHWEAAYLAPRISLARGWEKQLDERYDAVLLSSALNARSYRAWLLSEGVAFVALPDAALDPSSAREGALIRAGLPYLQPVFASAHWRIYAVRGATPLVQGPGRLTALGHQGFALRASAAGRLLVRIHYSRYFTLSAGRGCVQAGPGGWTTVRAQGAGELLVAARFSLARSFSSGPACRG